MDNNLGNIIKNAKVRAGIYGTYVIVGVAIGALQIGFAASTAGAQPEWLTIALAVFGYLGIPVGSLAVANSSIIPQTVVNVPDAAVTIEASDTDNTPFTH